MTLGAEAPKTLMLVDPDQARRRVAAAAASRSGWRNVQAGDLGAARTLLHAQETGPVAALMVDGDGESTPLEIFIESFHAVRPGVAVIVATNAPYGAAANRCLRAGARDLIARPLVGDRLSQLLESLASPTAMSPERHPLFERVAAGISFENLVGSTPDFRTALAIAAKAARSRSHIVIEGPAGAGKHQLARAIHSASSRAAGPFRIVDCARGGPRGLASLLFGHVQGAFAGAFDNATGGLRDAAGGTVFLDHADALPADIQRDIADAVQSGRVTALGGRAEHDIDVRIVAASDAPLKPLVAGGSVREDFYFRLAQVAIVLPALKDRAGDIVPLARHLLTRFAGLPAMRPLGLGDDAAALLCAHDWPGNVRELHDMLFRAGLGCASNAITPADLPGLLAREAGHSPAAILPHAESTGVMLYTAESHVRALADIEADVIRLAIGHYHGRMSEVARRLGIGRSTLYRKLADLGIDTAA